MHLCMCVFVIMQYILSNLLLAFNKSCFFFAFVIKQNISVSAHINLSHPFKDCLGTLSLMIGLLTLLLKVQCFKQGHIILLHPCEYFFGWDSQLLSQKRWLHFIQKSTTYCRMYFSIPRKLNSGKIWVWEKILIIWGNDHIALLSEAEISVVTLTMENKCIKHRNRLCASKMGWERIRENIFLNHIQRKQYFLYVPWVKIIRLHSFKRKDMSCLF